MFQTKRRVKDFELIKKGFDPKRFSVNNSRLENKIRAHGVNWAPFCVTVFGYCV